MTKFEELCDAVCNAQRHWAKFRDRSYRCLDLLSRGFAEYCQIPREGIQLIPLDKEAEPNTRYSVVGATHLGKDGYWHLGVLLRILDQRLLIEMCVTEMHGRQLVRAGKDGPSRELDFSKQSETNRFYDEIGDNIKTFFEHSPGPTDTSLKEISFGGTR